MKGLLKRAAAVLLMAVCLMNLSACSASEDTANAPKIATEGTPADEYTSQMVLQQALSILSISEEQLTIQKGIYESQGSAETVALIDILKEAKSEYGTIHAVDTANAKVVLLPDQTYTLVVGVTFDEGEMNYVMNVNTMTGAMNAEFIPAGGDDAGQTVSQKMEAGGVYAALGIGTVFAVLIFISLLICCFKFIHAWEEGRNNAGKDAERGPAPVPAPAPVAPAPIAAAPAQDLMEDAELVAVISAAIAAYEGTTSNGLVVRSIRRLPNSRWK